MEHRRQELTASATAGTNDKEFSLREWAVKARMVSRVNTNSRRFSASYVTSNTSFREDALTAARSFRSSITTTVSSTASSPGCSFRGEIDPSTYSFTTAIKALQARSSGYNWDCLSPYQGEYTLHSKWNEAEKYICNPLSGQVPLECLSAKTLLSSGRSFRHIIPGAGRVTMSAPLIYHPPHSRINNHVLPTNTKPSPHKDRNTTSIQEKRRGTATRDVGIQSTMHELSASTSTSATTSPPTPPIKERSITKREIEEQDSPSSNNTDNTKFMDKEETRDKVEETKMEGIDDDDDDDDDQEVKANRICMSKQGGCCLLLSWKSLWMRNRHGRDKQKARTNNCLAS